MKNLLLSLSVLLLVSTFTVAQDSKDFDSGVAKFKARDYQGVITQFSAALSNADHNKRYDEDLYWYRGQSYFHTGEYAKSLDDLNQALSLDHYNKGMIIWYQARCYDKLGKTKEAAAAYDSALKAAENNKKTTALIHYDRGQFHLRHGEKTAADADLAAAVEFDPNVQHAAVAHAVTAGPATKQPATTATATRTPGEDKKTQMIIRTNPNASKPDATPGQTAQQATATPAAQNAELVSAIAATYKDEKRYALVIGNSNYSKDIGVLKNPLNDATDVATELRKSNFDVQLITNATYVQMREAMRKFQEKLTAGPRDQTVGLFYYAGHGVAYQDENYLVPIDADVKFEDDITRMCFPVQRMVLANMERTNSRMNIVILDACRNNPFPATNRAIAGGLGEMKKARGSFIAYATAPGAVASDGSGRNGLYTQELVKALRKPGLTIEQVFKEVRMNVMRMSGDKQYTWDSSNIIGEFYFKF
ncbi:MAG TPA: caspase family protein [Chryseolinea sp.]|nr:caspase family protein [Chryseolinea sp.]